MVSLEQTTAPPTPPGTPRGQSYADLGREELHELWFKLHRAVVRAFDAAGIKVWVAMASVLPFARDRVPLPWHAITEYGFLAADRSRVRAAFREQGLECNTRRGIVRCWFADGARIKSVYGSRLLTSVRTQTWPWADLFPYEAGLGGRGGAGRQVR